MAPTGDSFPALPILQQLGSVLERGERRLNEVWKYRIGVFHFDVVQGCQLRCIGCPNSTLLPKIDHITPDGFDQCLRNVDVRQVETLRLFNYGEPFLHPALEALLPVVKQQSFSIDRVEISTNAMICDEGRIQAILDSGVVTHLVVSCDGDGTPADFERVRPPAKWSKLIAFLEAAQRLKSRLGSPVQLMTRTICSSPEGQARWRSVLETRGWTPEFRVWKILPQAAENPTERAPCVQNRVCWPMTGVNLFVDCHGNVIPCCSTPNLPPLGNLYQQKFSEIHGGEARARMLEMLKTGRVNDPICGQCED